MASTVRSRPSHYETLGLKPTASTDEIARAFAREVSVFRPRPVGGVALVSIAFETLRDPGKRRAYDASIGLSAEPEPAPRPEAQFVIARARRPLAPREKDRLFTPEPAVVPQAAPEAVKPAVQPEMVARPVARPQQLRPRDFEDFSVDWKRSALIAGGLVAAVGLFGAFAGSRVGNDIEAQQAGVTLPLPPAKSHVGRPAGAAAAPAPAAPLNYAEARPERTRRVATARAERTPVTEQPLVVADKQSVGIESADSQVASSQGPGGQFEQKATAQAAAAEPAVAEAAPVAAAPASLRLPNAVIARTIGRIGYACGQVASTAPVEGGAAGVYKVTCTSGDSYQASPVRGRYHFRRLGSR